MPNVLVAIDGSEHANRAFARAARLFDPATDYLLLSVVPPWSPATALVLNEELRLPGGKPNTTSVHGTASTGMPFSPTPDSVEATVQALYDYSRRALSQAESVAGVRGEHLIEEAKPRRRRIGRVICDVAKEHGADAIVVGSHGIGVGRSVLLGSVSKYVVHHAHCPVLVMRAHD